MYSSPLDNKITPEVDEEDLNISKIQFSTGNTLTINKQQGELKLIDKNNEIQLVILVKNEGLVVTLNALQLNINTVEEINLRGKNINLEASEQIQLKTVGNLLQEVGNDCSIKVGRFNKVIAQTQKITAVLGNVEIKANDDVRLDGERIKFNCD